jgi:hypothetical protein
MALHSIYSKPQPMMNIWKDSIALFKRRWSTLLLASFSLMACVVGIALFSVLSLPSHDLRTTLSNHGQYHASAMLHASGTDAMLTIIIMGIMVVCISIAGGRWLTDLCMRDLQKKSINAWESLQFVVRKIHHLLLYAVCQFSLVLLGLLCFIIPGLILALMVPFGYFFVLYNKSNAFSAIKQACQLVWGRWWHTLVCLLVPYFICCTIIWIISLVMTVTTAAFSATALVTSHSVLFFAIYPLVHFFLSVALIAFSYCVLSCVFHNLLAEQKTQKHSK